MSPRPLRVGARTSRLARFQADLVIDALQVSAEFVGIRTAGDIANDLPIGAIEGTGVFTRELERALVAGDIDLAVHSLKDLSTEEPDGIEIRAFLTRADPRDALVLAEDLRRAESESGTDPLDALPHGATVGTSSLRRRAFLLRLRPDLDVVPIRGNVPTRLEKLRAGACDALVLAAAGLHRLGFEAQVDGLLATSQFPPAPGQGAVAVQVRSGDAETMELVAALNDPATATTVTAERAFLRRIEGGCQVPAGALAEIDAASGTITLTTLICSPDGSVSVAASAAGGCEEPAALGLAAAERALLDGGADILARLRRAAPDMTA